MEYIRSAGSVQTGLPGSRQTGVILANDLYPFRSFLPDDLLQDGHRRILPPVVDKEEFDVRIGLGEKALRTAGDIILYTVHRYDDRNEGSKRGFHYMPIWENRSGMRTTILSSIIPGLFQA